MPIFAVSASLVERECQTYIDAGFDGWILKPIDFKRLSVLLSGIVNKDVKMKCLYKTGEWERGGWLHKRHFAVVSSKSRTWHPSSMDGQSLDGDEEALDSVNSSGSDDLVSVPEESKPLENHEGQNTKEHNVESVQEEVAQTNNDAF